MIAICPGSFDPPTFGHLDIIERAHRLFDEVVVAVGRNTTKNYLFDLEERLELLRAITAHLDRIKVLPVSGLLVDFCSEHHAKLIVKGLRFAGDFELELQQAQVNAEIGGLETIMLPASKQWGTVSSTIIREVAHFGGDVSAFVPDLVVESIVSKIKDGKWSNG